MSPDLNSFFALCTDGQQHDGVPVVTSWDRRVIIHGGPINGLEVPVQASASESGRSSIIRDGGDAQRLQLKSQPKAEAPSEDVKNNTLLSLGTGFDQDSTRETFVRLDEDHAICQATHEARPLSELIRRRIHDSFPGRTEKRFLPLSELDKLITLASVYNELHHHTDFRTRTAEECNSLAHAVCDETAPTTDRPSRAGGLTTRKKLFATLVLMGRVNAIELFIENELFDVHLPFHLPVADQYTNGPLHWTRTRDGVDTSIPIAFFQDWTDHDKDMFVERYQWQLLAPFFHFKPRPQDYVFQDGIILPFVEDLEGKGHEPVISGGFSEVWRVRIHDDHYNHHSVR